MLVKIKKQKAQKKCVIKGKLKIIKFKTIIKQYKNV